jgi:putative glutathione S-transferase
LKIQYPVQRSTNQVFLRFVFRCGFAQSQEAYDRAVNELFSTLDKLENHLSNSRYLCGDKLTLVDICLFTTLIRFDIAYNVLFKCTKKKLYEYTNLHAYMRDIYQVFVLLKKCFGLSIICVVHLLRLVCVFVSWTDSQSRRYL